MRCICKFITYNNVFSTNGLIKWSDNVHNDLFNILKKFNSDFRILSSYKFQVPSLNLYSTNITPTTFNFSKLLSSSNIKNERGITIFDKINKKILEMLGVRFIVDNKPIKIKNINLVTKINQESEMIYLYEINNFTSFKNPTEILYADKISDINNILLSKNFNINSEFILNDKEINIFNNNLDKLDKFSFKTKNNYIITKGSSKNKTVVVLPYQFSSCFISKNKNLIFPVNGGLLGILYNKNLDDKIYYKQSLFYNFDCVLKDYFLFKKITN